MTINLLFLTQVLPYPLDAGPKVRAYYMLRHLSQRHQVTLVSFVRADDRPEYVQHLAQICRAVHTVPIRRSLALNLRAAARGLLTGLPIVIVRDDSAEMAALLRRLTHDTHFDVIHADQLSMAAWAQLAAASSPSASPFAPFVLRALRAPSRLRDPNPRAPHLLLDAHNAIYKLTERMAAENRGPRRWIAQREARAFRRYEADTIRRFDALLTVTDEDRGLLLDLLQEPERSQHAAKLTTIPICVDPDQVEPMSNCQLPMSNVQLPIANVQLPMSNCQLPIANVQLPMSNCQLTIDNCQLTIDNSQTILHLGTMFWPPNVSGVLWFARAVLPLIWQQAPEARFVVVGKNPPAEVQALAADPRVEVTGYVADPQPYLQAASVFVTPLHSGGGMRVKILDAWLWGLPVVSTPIGAEGIQLRDGENILLAGDAASFAAAVVRLLTDPELNQRLRRNGRRWVEQTYAWQVVYRRVDDVYGAWESGGRGEEGRGRR